MNLHAKPETAFPRDDAVVRRDWTRDEAQAIHDMPLMDLLFRAQTVHRRSFDANRVQMSRLLSIKTGGCAEDCGYCSQSAHHESGLKATKLMEVERVLAEARKAKAPRATAWVRLGANPRTAIWTRSSP
jgi:biotin synthase